MSNTRTDSKGEEMDKKETEADKHLNIAMQISAQAWCTKSTSSKVMDVELAKAFADIIVSCATRKQIEIAMRNPPPRCLNIEIIGSSEPYTGKYVSEEECSQQNR